MERKLAAIFSTDVQGYSRLMGEDEEATIQTLKTYREVIAGLIENHHGRVVDAPGDNLLAEFASAVDAVKSAVAIQRELKTRNAELAAHRRMEFRIGLNVGDVIADEGRLYGDGVNIAARIESLADGGGIFVSANVHEQVKNKLEVAFTYQGEQTVKNIADPVRVYKVELDAEQTPHPALLEQPTELPLPDKPSIAVLPFTNMSNDPEQEYFSDGITDDIITDLSKISGLFVIARNSTFTYKGQAVEVGEVGKRLGVRYVLEGSIRKVGTRVRINVQLIDASTGGHVWADRYDRELTDIFALQDEITQQIVTALQAHLTPSEQAHLARLPTANLEAYDCYLRGREAFWQVTRASHGRAQSAFEQAIALDPAYAVAYAYFALTHVLDWVYQWTHNPQALERAEALAHHALNLDESVPTTHMALSEVHYWRGQAPQAIAAGERAVALNPNDADSVAYLAHALSIGGQPERSLVLLDQAMRLNPHYPVLYLSFVGQTYFIAGRTTEAIAAFERARTRSPEYLTPHVMLAALYSESDQREAAHNEAAEILRINPDFSFEQQLQRVPLRDADIERMRVGLRKAGLK